MEEEVEARDSSLRMEVKVAGLHRNDSVTCDVVLRGLKGEGVSGKIVITRGEGLFTLFSQSLKDIAGTGIGYEELQGIRISLGLAHPGDGCGDREVWNRAGRERKPSAAVKRKRKPSKGDPTRGRDL